MPATSVKEAMDWSDQVTEILKIAEQISEFVQIHWLAIVCIGVVYTILNQYRKIRSLNGKIAESERNAIAHQSDDTEMMALQQRCQQLTAELSMIRHENSDLQIKCDRSNNDLSVMSHQINKLQQQLSHNQSMINDKKRLITQLQSKVDTLKMKENQSIQINDNRNFSLPSINVETFVEKAIDTTQQISIAEILATHKSRMGRWNASMDEIRDNCTDLMATPTGDDSHTSNTVPMTSVTGETSDAMEKDSFNGTEEKSESLERRVTDEWNLNRLFELHCNQKYLTDEQLQRLEGICALVAELNQQRTILQKKISDLSNRLNNAKTKQSETCDKYDSIRASRLESEENLQRLFEECSRLCAIENGLMVSKCEYRSIINALDSEMNGYSQIYNQCRGLITQYNSFQSDCNQYIPKINDSLRNQWQNFERQWANWDVCDILCWLKYKLNWFYSHPKCLSLVEKNMRQQCIKGNRLLNLAKSDLMKIGFEPNYDLCCDIFQCIQLLCAKYAIIDDTTVQNSDDMSVVQSSSRKSRRNRDKKSSIAQRIAKKDNSEQTTDINSTFVIPQKFKCALSGVLMSTPVQAFDNHIYERSVIEKYLAQYRKSPITDDIASEDCLHQFTVNQMLKLEIDYFRQVHNCGSEDNIDPIMDTIDNESGDDLDIDGDTIAMNEKMSGITMGGSFSPHQSPVHNSRQV